MLAKRKINALPNVSTVPLGGSILTRQGYGLLDVGCGGSKAFSTFTSERYPNLNLHKVDVGLDIVLPNRKPYFAFIRGSVLSLPLREQTFSESVCSHVLEHLHYDLIPLAVRELKKVSRNVLLIFPTMLFNYHRDHRSVFIMNRFFPYPRLVHYVQRIIMEKLGRVTVYIRWFLLRKLKWKLEIIKMMRRG